MKSIIAVFQRLNLCNVHQALLGLSVFEIRRTSMLFLTQFLQLFFVSHRVSHGCMAFWADLNSWLRRVEQIKHASYYRFENVIMAINDILLIKSVFKKRR